MSRRRGRVGGMGAREGERETRAESRGTSANVTGEEHIISRSNGRTAGSATNADADGHWNRRGEADNRCGRARAVGGDQCRCCCLQTCQFQPPMPHPCPHPSPLSPHLNGESARLVGATGPLPDHWCCQAEHVASWQQHDSWTALGSKAAGGGKGCRHC